MMEKCSFFMVAQEKKSGENKVTLCSRQFFLKYHCVIFGRDFSLRSCCGFATTVLLCLCRFFYHSKNMMRKLISLWNTHQKCRKNPMLRT
mmetsp:Transcript_30524/g.45470  ORF Transcript_30524/g.45470 Transcript_30524/m.45470 type:complete len:90 (+) Transcript_30524:1141-1410(+)